MSQNVHPRRKRRARGMTLIEIMVVITILGLLTAAIAVAVIPRLNEAKRDKAALDIKTLEGALKQYYAKKGNYPDTGTGLKALVDQQIIERLEPDPWGAEYVYMNENGKPVVMSYGADKSPGGEGNDADISSNQAQAKNN